MKVSIFWHPVHTSVAGMARSHVESSAVPPSVSARLPTQPSVLSQSRLTFETENLNSKTYERLIYSLKYNILAEVI